MNFFFCTGELLPVEVDVRREGRRGVSCVCVYKVDSRGRELRATAAELIGVCISGAE